MFEKYLFQIRAKSPGRTIFHWLYRWYKVALAGAFLIVLGLGVWGWYYNTEQYSWTSEQKTKFWDEYANEIDFKESRFDSVIAELDARAEKHAANREVERDIFRLKKPIAPEPEPEPASISPAPAQPEVPPAIPLQD
jgi:hypothetical protein